MSMTSVADLLAASTRDTRNRNDTLRTDFDNLAGDIVIRHRMHKLKEKIKATSNVYKILGDNYNGMVTMEGNFQYSFQVLDVTDIAKKVDFYQTVSPVATPVLTERKEGETFVEAYQANLLTKLIEFHQATPDERADFMLDKGPKRSAVAEALVHMSLPDIKPGDFDILESILENGRNGTARYICHTPSNRISNHLHEISYLADQQFVEREAGTPPSFPVHVLSVSAAVRYWKSYK